MYVRSTPLLYLLTFGDADLFVFSLENASRKTLLSIPLPSPGATSNVHTEFYVAFLRAAKKCDGDYVEKHTRTLKATLTYVSVLFPILDRCPDLFE